MYTVVLLTALSQGAALPGCYGKKEATPAKITVRLPAGASFFVDDVQSPYKGQAYAFDTPPLELGRTYGYTVRAEVTRDGRLITATKKIKFKARDAVTVDFSKLGEPASATEPAERPAGKAVLPATPAPAPVVASIDPDGRYVLLDEVVFKAIPYQMAITRLVDGVEEKVTKTAYKWVYEQRQSKLDIKSIQAQDGGGQAIAQDDLVEMLRRPTPAYLSRTKEVDPFYLQSFRRKTLILVAADDTGRVAPGLPQPVVPSVPAGGKVEKKLPASPQPRPAVRERDVSTLRPDGPAPSLKLAHIDDGNLVIIESVTKLKEEMRTRTIKTPDGAPTTVSFKVKVLFEVPIKVVYKLKDAAAYRVDGTPIPTKELTRLLEKERVVLVAFQTLGLTPRPAREGEPLLPAPPAPPQCMTISPYYLQVIGDDTVILVLPMRYGYGMPPPPPQNGDQKKLPSKA